jgi:hypothetical protein
MVCIRWNARRERRFQAQCGARHSQGGAIQVQGKASFGQKSTFIFRAGTLSAAQFDNAGSFSWQSGTLGITGADGAQLGYGILPENLLIDSGKGLRVSNTLTVGTGTTLTVTDGQLQSGLLAVRGGTASLSGQAASNGVQLGSGTLVVNGTGSIVSASCCAIPPSWILARHCNWRTHSVWMQAAA